MVCIYQLRISFINPNGAIGPDDTKSVNRFIYVIGVNRDNVSNSGNDSKGVNGAISPFRTISVKIVIPFRSSLFSSNGSISVNGDNN